MGVSARGWKQHRFTRVNADVNNDIIYFKKRGHILDSFRIALIKYLITFKYFCSLWP